MLAVRPRSCFPPLLSPWSPPHLHPTHTLGSWGVEKGAGVENVEDRINSHLAFIFPPFFFSRLPLRFPLGSTGVVVSFLVFVAQSRIPLVTMSLYEHVSPCCNIVSPSNEHFPSPSPPSSRFLRYMMPLSIGGGGLVHGAARRLMSCEPPCNA